MPQQRSFNCGSQGLGLANRFPLATVNISSSPVPCSANSPSKLSKGGVIVSDYPTESGMALTLEYWFRRKIRQHEGHLICHTLVTQDHQIFRGGQGSSFLYTMAQRVTKPACSSVPYTSLMFSVKRDSAIQWPPATFLLMLNIMFQQGKFEACGGRKYVPRPTHPVRMIDNALILNQPTGPIIRCS